MATQPHHVRFLLWAVLSCCLFVLLGFGRAGATDYFTPDVTSFWKAVGKYVQGDHGGDPSDYFGEIVRMAVALAIPSALLGWTLHEMLVGNFVRSLLRGDQRDGPSQEAPSEWREAGGAVAFIGSAPALGHLLGMEVEHRSLLFEVNKMATLAALALLVGGVLFGLRQKRSLESFGVLAYGALLVLVEPTLYAGRPQSARVLAALWLAPLIGGLVVTLRRGPRLTALGAWLLLFAATVSLTYNCRHGGQGVGFLDTWVVRE